MDPVCKTSPVLSCRVFLRMSFYNGNNRVFQSSTPRRIRANGWLTALSPQPQAVWRMLSYDHRVAGPARTNRSLSKTPRVLMSILREWNMRSFFDRHFNMRRLLLVQYKLVVPLPARSSISILKAFSYHHPNILYTQLRLTGECLPSLPRWIHCYSEPMSFMNRPLQARCLAL